MSIFTTLGQKRLHGISETKKLTIDAEVLRYNPKEVYVPIVDPVSSKPLKLNVNVGDEVKVGTVIGIREECGIPVFATVSGKIIREELMFHGYLGRNVKHYVIENDEKDSKEKALKILDANATPEEIVERMKEAGLVGCGGAGFPTYIKYRGVKDIDTIIINGVECEPYITVDHVALINNMEEIVSGIKFLLKASGASKAIIAFKKTYKDLIEKYKDINSSNPEIEVALVNSDYPTGWERKLIKDVTKRTYNRLPSEAHVILNNVSTCLYLSRACLKGEPLVRKIITVSGEGVNNPHNVDLPIFTRTCDVIEFLGGYKVESASVSLGGPMCSRGIMDDKAVILSNTNAITIMPRLKLNTLPCLRCGACTEHCPSGLQPVEIKIAYQAKNTERMMALTPWHCIGCGLCSYSCPSKIDVLDFVKKAKLLTSVQLKKQEAAQKAKEGNK